MKHRFQARLIMLPAIVMLVVIGCSQQKPSSPQSDIQLLPFSVVATGGSGMDMREATTFAWTSSLQTISQEQSRENKQIEAILQDAIIATLQQKGYRYSDVPGRGDLIVNYQVALQEGSADRDMPETHPEALQPSLNVVSPDPRKYEKGILEIEIKDRLTGRTAWRSALQGFANPGLSDAERRQRIGIMVDRMLAGVPEK